MYGVGCKAGTQKKTSVGIPECCEGVGVNMCNPVSYTHLPVAKAACWTMTDVEARKRGEQTGLDTLVVHAVNDDC